MDRNKRFPPGPRGNLIFGHFAEYSHDPLGFLTRCSATYGDVAAFRLPGIRMYLLCHPEHIGRVFAETNTNFINHGGMHTPLSRMLFGGGMLTTEGDEWRRQHALAFPAFKHSQIPQYTEIMIDETRRTLDSWKIDERVDLFDEMTRLTLRTFMRTLFRSSSSGQYDEITRIFFDLSDGFLLKRRLQSLGLIWRIPVQRRYRRLVGRLDSMVDDIIRDRRAEPNSHNDLLAVLMSARYEDGRTITNQQLRGEIKTFLFNGVFGTGLPLAWSIHLIAQHPEIAKQLSVETLELTGDGISPDMDMRQCCLARWILKEALRLYPPIWASGREALIDCEIGDFFVPKGTQMILSQWIMHRDPRFWAEPDRFDPSRWSEPSGRPKYAYFPHGGGPRFCMGDAFAELLSVIVLSMTAQRFSFWPVSNKPVGLIPSYALFPNRNVEVLIGRAV